MLIGGVHAVAVRAHPLALRHRPRRPVAGRPGNRHLTELQGRGALRARRLQVRHEFSSTVDRLGRPAGLPRSNFATRFYKALPARRAEPLQSTGRDHSIEPRPTAARGPAVRVARIVGGRRMLNLSVAFGHTASPKRNPTDTTDVLLHGRPEIRAVTTFRLRSNSAPTGGGAERRADPRRAARPRPRRRSSRRSQPSACPGLPC